MAVIRNTAAMRLRGKVGNTTYYTQGRRQIARVSENSSNYGTEARRSPAQQARRILWANLVNIYKASKFWMKGAFETKASNETDYNKFMSVNLPLARIALTKEQASIGCAVLDEYYISQGSLHPVTITRSGNIIRTDIVSYYLTSETPNKNLGTFSSYLISANPWLKEGSQLSFIGYTQDFHVSGSPKVYVQAAELTLDTSSTTLLADLPLFEHLTNEGGFLEWKDTDPDAYYAVVHSNSVNGTLEVSSQRLLAGDTEPAEQYSSATQQRQAMQSYGVDEAYFLESGDM